MKVQYLEIVSRDVDADCAIYATVMGLHFGPPDPALGQARTARLADGGMVGIRAPMHASEAPIIRPYWRVDDIAAAVAAAEQAGCEIAHPPMALPGHGTFAICRHGGNDHGFWQLPAGHD